MRCCLPYQFSYDKFGFRFSITALPCLIPALPARPSPQPFVRTAQSPATDWNFTHKWRFGLPNDGFRMPIPMTRTSSGLPTDLNPSSPHYNRIYACGRFSLSTPAACLFLRRRQRRWQPHRLVNACSSSNHQRPPLGQLYAPHVTPDGTVYTTETNNPQQKGFLFADLYLISLGRWRRDLADTSARTP